MVKKSLASTSIFLLLPSAITFFAPVTPIHANVRFLDNSHVLSARDRIAIMGAARTTPLMLTVWVMHGGYGANKQGFAQQANHLVLKGGVVLALDTVDRYFHVAASKKTGLTTTDTQTAKNAALPSFKAHQWAAGIVAAIKRILGARARSSFPTQAI